jgi:protein-L-isoaspartate(D-aspartate) O-methyltransferase
MRAQFQTAHMAGLLPLFFQLIQDRSTGPTNADLVNHLKECGTITDERIEAAFRAVDRGAHLAGAPQGAASGTSAYDDAPVRCGHFHISQPALYAEVIESLDLQAGMSFLNIGCGTGYLSSIVAELVGKAVHHGVDIHEDVIQHARKMFRASGKDFIEFFQVNVRDLDLQQCPRYQRIYVGACVGRGNSSKAIMELLEVGGILVGPFETPRGQQIRRIVRESETHFQVTDLKPVSFGHLLPSAHVSAEKFVLPSPMWTPHTHTCHSKGFQKAVLEVLMGTMHMESPLNILPRELLVDHVFGYVHPRWFDSTEAGDGDPKILEIRENGTILQESWHSTGDADSSTNSVDPTLASLLMLLGHREGLRLGRPIMGHSSRAGDEGNEVDSDSGAESEAEAEAEPSLASEEHIGE